MDLPILSAAAIPAGEFEAEPITIILQGDPVPYRTRINFQVPEGYNPRSKRGKGKGQGLAVKVWQTKESSTIKYQKRILERAGQAMANRPLLSAPFQLIIRCYFERPAGWSAWKHRLCDMGLVAHTVRPDWDNLHKCAVDALMPKEEEAKVIADDSSLCRQSDHSGKFYAEQGSPGRLEMRIVPLAQYPAQISTCPPWLKERIQEERKAGKPLQADLPI